MLIPRKSTSLDRDRQYYEQQFQNTADEDGSNKDEVVLERATTLRRGRKLENQQNELT